MKQTSAALQAEGLSDQGSLDPVALPPQACRVSREGWFVDEDGVRTVSVGRTVVSQYDVADKAGRNHAITLLARCKYATQREIAAAFGLTTRTVNRLCGRAAREGIGGLVRRTRSDKTPGAVAAQVCRLRDQGVRVRRIAERTGVSARTVRALLVERGYDPYDGRGGHQLELGEAEGAAEEPEGAEPEGEEAEDLVGTEETPEDEGAGGSGAEAQAGPCGGLEAGVEFVSGPSVWGAGALLGVAVEDGVLLEEARKVYGGLRAGIYGLRALVEGLYAMAWLGIRNAESLKGQDPEGLGRLLGLPRAFEVKTLRRKLREAGERGEAAAWHAGVSQRWVAETRDEIGTLYVDGHTRAYYGTRKIAKGWCSRRRLCQPATTETWTNDGRGEPLLRVSHEAHPTISQVLPEMLSDVRKLIGDQRCLVAFDRGGWSGQTFKQLVDAGFDFVTYRPGPFAPLAPELFCDVPVEEGGRPRVYRLAETRGPVRGYGEARLIVVLCESGKQTPIVTSRETTPALEVARELFGRWRQENYFKYMRANYSLDALVDYGCEAVEDREIPNPARQALSKELRAARAALRKLEGRAGGLGKPPRARPGKADPAGISETLQREIAAQREKIQKLQSRQTALPRRAKLSETERADEVKLSVERKLLTDVVKMAAYRTECELVRRVEATFARKGEEGHAFIRTVLRQPGELRVEGRTLHVTLAPMSAPRFTRALTALCEAVNADNPTYPESPWRLRFAVQQDDPNRTSQ